MQRAGQALVQRAVLVEEAGRMGLTVTDNDVRNELMHGPFAPVLFPGGMFIGEDRYDDFVQNNFNMSRTDFETAAERRNPDQSPGGTITGGLTVTNSAASDAISEAGDQGEVSICRAFGRRICASRLRRRMPS